jgi:hypothetical protein
MDYNLKSDCCNTTNSKYHHESNYSQAGHNYYE